MRHRLLAISIAGLLGACQHVADPVIRPAVSPQLKAALDPYETGKRHLENRNYGLALTAFRQAQQQQGSTVRVLNALGITYTELGRDDVALAYFLQAQRLEPESTVTAQNLAEFQRRQSVLANAAGPAVPPHGTVTSQPEQPAPAFVPAPTPAQVLREMPPLRASDETPATIVSNILPAPLALAIAPAVLEGTDSRVVAGLTRIELRVINGTGRTQMATRMASYLQHNGAAVTGVSNADNYGYKVTLLRYRPGYRDAVTKLAKQLAVQPDLQEVRDLREPIQLTLGADLIAFDQTLSRG